MKTSHKWFILNSGGGATPPPFEWFESFASTQQPLANPLVIETEQQFTIVAQNSQMSIDGGYLRKQGSGALGTNKLRSIESIESGSGRLVGFKIIPNATQFIIGLETTSAGTISHAFQSSTSGDFYARVRGETRDIAFDYVNGNEYTLLILLKAAKGAFWIVKDGSNYYLALTDTFYNYTEHKAYMDLGPSTLLLVDWFRVNLIEALESDWPFDVDSVSAPSSSTPFTHSTNGWIHLRLGTATTSGDMLVKFRIQDANNYFLLTFRASLPHTVQLSVFIAGVETVLRTHAQMGGFVAGADLKIFLNGNSIKIWGTENAIKADITNANFTTETNGEVTSIGNGVITDIHTMPYDITSVMDPLDI